MCHRQSHGLLKAGTGRDVGGEDRVAVHRRVVEHWQRQRRDDVVANTRPSASANLTDRAGRAITRSATIRRCSSTERIRLPSDRIGHAGQLFGHRPQPALQIRVVRPRAGMDELRVAALFPDSVRPVVVSTGRGRIGCGPKGRQRAIAAF